MLNINVKMTISEYLFEIVNVEDVISYTDGGGGHASLA